MKIPFKSIKSIFKFKNKVQQNILSSFLVNSRSLILNFVDINVNNALKFDMKIFSVENEIIFFPKYYLKT